jgi:hypothetical protein
MAIIIIYSGAKVKLGLRNHGGMNPVGETRGKILALHL